MRGRRNIPNIFGFCLAGLATAAGVVALRPTQSTGQEYPAPSISGVLVLRNGNVLTGAVQRYGDHYRVEAVGAIVEVPSGQVEMFAPSLEEAYEERRGVAGGLSADGHLELARWCMQVNLLGPAARELLDARRLDPQHSALGPLDMRLRQMMALQAARPAGDAAPSYGTLSQGDTASFRLGEGSDASPPEISLPAQTRFVRSIQPMLIRSCAIGGCHQPGSPQRMQLDRWALEGNGNPALVRRNLSAVVRELNGADPKSSPLLHWARLTHGGPGAAASRPLTAHQASLLLEWLNQAAGVAPLGDNDGAEPLIAAPPSPLEERNDEAIDATEPAQHLSPPEPFEPRDEFDPEIFNRRRRPDERDAKEEVDATESAPLAS
jgi:hypothetical protein